MVLHQRDYHLVFFFFFFFFKSFPISFPLGITFPLVALDKISNFVESGLELIPVGASGCFERKDFVSSIMRK